MILLLAKNIADNSNRIDNIAKHINKTNGLYCLDFLMITMNIYVIAKVVKKHEEKIKELETQIEEMKSKGE